MSACSRGDKQSFNCKISFKNPSFRQPVWEFRKALLLRCSYFLTRPGSHTVLPLIMKKKKKKENLLIFWGQSCFVRGGLTKFFHVRDLGMLETMALRYQNCSTLSAGNTNVWECCSDLQSGSVIFHKIRRWHSLRIMPDSLSIATRPHTETT